MRDVIGGHRRSGFATWWGALAVAALTFALYWPSLSSGLVYDAEIQIAADDFIHDRRNLMAVLSLNVLAADVLDANRPVHLLSLMMDSALWGREPFGFHLTSNLLHALNAALVFLLLARLADGARRIRVLAASALAAGLFAVHPVLTEAVAEPSYREDLLATLFLLLGLHAAVSFASARELRARVALGSICVGALFLSAASKETGYVTAGILVGFGLIFHRLRPRVAWAGLITAAATFTFGFAVLQYLLRVEDSAIFEEAPPRLGGSLVGTLINQPRIWTFLLWQVADPTGLSADYTPQNVGWISPLAGFLVSALLLVAQALLAWRSRLAALGLVIFWAGILPVSNFLPLFRPVADRFLYLPMIGLASTGAGALLLLHRRALFATGAVAWGVWLLVLVPSTLERQSVFARALSLWEDSARKAPFSLTAATNLGYAQWEAGHLQAALDSYRRALRLSEMRSAHAWIGVALVMFDAGKLGDARTALSRAIELDPVLADPDAAITGLKLAPKDAPKIRAILGAAPPAPSR